MDDKKAEKVFKMPYSELIIHQMVDDFMLAAQAQWDAKPQDPYTMPIKGDR